MAGTANPFFVDQASANLTTSITTYTSGDMLGHVTGPLDGFPIATGGAASCYAVITTVSVIDYAKVLGAVDVLFFNAATTPQSDNAANSWSDADMNKLVGWINIPAPTVSANNYAVTVPNLWIVGQTDSNSKFYGNMITRSANGVFGAATDIHLHVSGFYFS